MINYAPIEFKGPAFEEIFMELLHQNETISQEKVRLITDIKAETIITEMSVNPTIQAFTCGEPVFAGSIDINDAILRPCKQMTADKFCTDDLRFSRFSTKMRSGAWETLPSDWQKIVMETYGIKTSRLMEEEYWNGASAATKAAVALLPVGPGLTAEEKAYVAAAPLTLCDGVLTYLIYNQGAIGSSIDVVGTVITVANIWDEYKKIYQAIPTVLLKAVNIKDTKIYAPESHLQMIQIYNTDQLYRDKFSIDGSGNYYFLGVKIEFVPLAENTMIAGRWSDLLWGTDLTSDYSFVKMDKVTATSEEWFVKQVFTKAAAAMIQTQKVTYVG